MATAGSTKQHPRPPPTHTLNAFIERKQAGIVSPSN